MWAVISLLVLRETAQVITVIFACSRSMPYMAYIVNVVTEMWWLGGHTSCLCGLFVTSTSGIIFNPSAGAIINHIQLAKDIDPYFKTKIYVEYPGHRKPVLILLNGLSKFAEREHDRN